MEATGNRIKAHRRILPARRTHLDPYGDGRLKPNENLVVSSVEVGVYLLTRVTERITALSPNSEQYHFLQVVIVEGVSPLSVVIALRYAGATVTATDTPIHVDSVGGNLRDFDQHRMTAPRCVRALTEFPGVIELGTDAGSSSP